jgi:hypothetical protein
VSFVVIASALGSIAFIQRRRTRAAAAAELAAARPADPSTAVPQAGDD